MENMMMQGMHYPRPRKKHGTRLRHIARTPMKTGTPTSGGGTDKGHGHLMKKMRKKSAFSIPRKDAGGYYPL